MIASLLGALGTTGHAKSQRWLGPAAADLTLGLDGGFMRISLETLPNCADCDLPRPVVVATEFWTEAQSDSKSTPASDIWRMMFSYSESAVIR